MCWQAASGLCELRNASSVASACWRVAGCCAAHYVCYSKSLAASRHAQVELCHMCGVRLTTEIQSNTRCCKGCALCLDMFNTSVASF